MASDAPAPVALDLRRSSVLPATDVLEALDSGPSGLTAAEAARRLVRDGPNAVRDHQARALGVSGAS